MEFFFNLKLGILLVHCNLVFIVKNQKIYIYL